MTSGPAAAASLGGCFLVVVKVACFVSHRLAMCVSGRCNVPCARDTRTQFGCTWLFAQFNIFNICIINIFSAAVFNKHADGLASVCCSHLHTGVPRDGLVPRQTDDDRASGIDCDLVPPVGGRHGLVRKVHPICCCRGCCP